ncbi:MAG: ABC transporter ATP-binding protein [Clostridiales Family XIII bacterium]|jgi:peptide/nickel transport system ATP-binding protein|nr:ABC transporter ATP-binding protein [Clostridiales Family XIII bacterium]
MTAEHTQPVLEVRELQISFDMYGKGLRRESLRVIQSLSLDVRKGEIVAVVGSSGAGKSLLAHAVLGILPSNARTKGRILYKGEELTPALQRRYRGTEIALIPQSVDYLDPLMRVGKQAVSVRGGGEARRTARAALARYGLAPRVERMFPFQLSGGMARRVLIVSAVVATPALIVADEPTPGLGTEAATETLRHFRQLADEGAAVLLVTHDIDLALHVADRIAVFYAGTTVEIAPVLDFKEGKDALRHPYSKAFLDALPQNAFRPIAGAQPYAGKLPQGCLFADRCAMRTETCADAVPMRPLRGGEVRCVHAT